MNKENAGIPEIFLSPYEPNQIEDKIYKMWDKSGYFNPDQCINDGVCKSDAEHFSIVLPPPNVTGQLHVGHAAMLAIEDIMVRFNRMQGKRTLWIPGTDHAAIATQSKVEKELAKKKIRKTDLGREEFLKQVEEFAQDKHDTIVNQVRKMGASVDWSREAYTLDKTREEAVYTAFKRMYDDDLIYRGHRIVNWDPKGQTVISDDEIVREEKTAKFYYFQYGPFEIGTARPETKFADKYIIVHPDDKRYAQYEHMQEFEVEWINGPIKATLIKDKVADMEMGTGAMTITPWHSQVDFELAEKYDLPKVQIIDQYGKLLPVAEEFAGMKITDAREKIVEKLQKKGLVTKIEEDYVLQQATAERTGGIIEPQVMEQWFIDVNKPARDGKSLKELMLDSVKSGDVKILPERFERVYYNWIENLRDWNISRQIWYGHRVPVWYKDGETLVSKESPGEGWEQDPDTLDTWFSSGLWTFSTLGWPNETEDFKNYHPTSVLETGYDIIFFWVARMILMSAYLLGEKPFETVYLHGLVRDEKGQKISKSLGNNVDPLDIIEKYGTDALRMALIIGTAPGQDAKLSDDKIRAYKKFANKLWNISRFVLTETSDQVYDPNFSNWSEADKELLQTQDALIREVTSEMNEYKFYLVGEKLYHYVWGDVADTILEDSKEVFADDDETTIVSRKQFLLHSLRTCLKLLHPFMPFVTEEIWQHINDDKLLMIQKWPEVKMV